MIKMSILTMVRTTYWRVHNTDCCWYRSNTESQYISPMVRFYSTFVEFKFSFVPPSTIYRFRVVSE